MKKNLLVLCAFMPMLATAADLRMKPGLWEITIKNEDATAVQMPKLTPQQQAQMEKMGIKLPTGGGIVVQTCLTKEQVDRDEPPKPSEDARQKCTQTESKRVGNTYTWKMVCTGEHAMSGNGSMTLQSPEAYTSNVRMVSQNAKSNVQNVNSSMQGKWLGANCPAQPRQK